MTTPRRAARVRQTAIVVMIASCAGGAVAGPPTLLIDRDLEERRVELVRIDDRGAVFDDERGLRRTLSLGEIVALMDPGSGRLGVVEPGVDTTADVEEDSLVRQLQIERAVAPNLLRGAGPRPRALAPEDRGWVLELTTGQRWFGRPGAESFEEELWWIGRDGRTTRVPLERIDRLGRLEPFGSSVVPSLPEAVNDDAVLLTNGDTLSGFLLAIGDHVEMDMGSTLRTPLDRVRLIDLASPAEAARGPMLWLEDGSIVSADGLRWSSVPGVAAVELVGTGDGTEAGSAGPDPVRLPIATIAGLAPNAALITPLSALDAPETRAAPGRYWAPPAVVHRGDERPLGMGDIELPGPMDAMWELPAAADRFAAQIVLPLEMRALGDLEIVVLVAQPFAEPVELTRVALDGRAPVRRVTAALSGTGTPERTLIVRLSEAGGGPVQDHAILRRALLRLASE